MTAFDKVNNYFASEENVKEGFYHEFINETCRQHPLAFHEITIDKGVRLRVNTKWDAKKGESYVMWICDMNHNNDTLFEDEIACDICKEICWQGQRLVASRCARWYDNYKAKLSE